MKFFATFFFTKSSIFCQYFAILATFWHFLELFGYFWYFSIYMVITLLDLFDDEEDDESLPEEYVSTLRLNILIGLVVLLVVTAVGTAMLLSISKIWGNHQENVWMSNPERSQ